MARNSNNIPTSEIEILNFIFHVVHHGEPTPVLMEETPIGNFEDFFKNRISEVSKGNKFYFSETSIVLKRLNEIESSIQSFREKSKELAIQFHEQQDGRIKPGVMILIKAILSGEVKYIIIKYDHENVLTYFQEGNAAILREISNTFSKSKNALQKSAIIDVANEEQYAVVVDKSDRKNITLFFKGFLGVMRKYSSQKLTDNLRKAFLATVKKYRSQIPKEITQRARSVFYDFVQNTESFERETFLQRILSNDYNENMEVDFDKELKKVDIAGEEFIFDKSLPKPKERKFSTAEGVTIHFHEDAEDTVEILNNSESTIIKITTTKLLEENVSNKELTE